MEFVGEQSQTSVSVSERMDFVLSGQDCPNCPNQGWYGIETRSGHEQVQCEFCETMPDSKFSRLRSVLSAAPIEQREPDSQGIDGPDWLRVSKSGHTLRVGWGDDMRIVARAPEHDKSLHQWLIDADRLCDGWNRVAPMEALKDKVLVPIEPTEEMLEAGAVRYENGLFPTKYSRVSAIYRSMVDAARKGDGK